MNRELDLENIDCEELLGDIRYLNEMPEEQVRNLLRQALEAKIYLENDIVNLGNEIERGRETNARLQQFIERRSQENRSRNEMNEARPNEVYEANQAHISQSAARAVILKPNSFRSAIDNFKDYLHGFKLYCKAAKIPIENWVDTLLTYLDTPAQRKVGRLYFTERDKLEPGKCFELITDAIMGKIPKAAVRAELHYQKQGEGEGVSSFASRLVELAELAFSAEDSEYKDGILNDVFVRGLADEDIFYKVFEGCETRSFDENYKIALAHEGVIFTKNRIIKNIFNLFFCHK